LVAYDLGSMTFPSAGGRNILGQGQFSKIVNCCPILLKFCTYMRRPHANIPVQYPNIRSETVDVTVVVMATIWPIIKDRAFFVNNINIHTIIVSNMIEKLCPFFKICFI
jgi:hypothetical protein